MISPDLPQRLREYRKQNDLSQMALAKKFGSKSHQRTISQIERGLSRRGRRKAFIEEAFNKLVEAEPAAKKVASDQPKKHWWNRAKKEEKPYTHTVTFTKNNADALAVHFLFLGIWNGADEKKRGEILRCLISL